MSAKYIIFDNNIPFVVPEYICMWTFYTAMIKAGLGSVATSCGKCYYEPDAGWCVLRGKQPVIGLDIPCKYKEDAEILNRHLFV